MNANHQHVCVGRTDVVLDEQPAIVFGRRRSEPRVVELQGCRTVEAFHEGLDTRRFPSGES